jgi:hypothetical protein
MVLDSNHATCCLLTSIQSIQISGYTEVSKPGDQAHKSQVRNEEATERVRDNS